MKQSLRLGTVSGIPVGLNWGLVLVAVLYAASLATGILPTAAPGFTTGAYWLVAALGVALFFGSILAHEIGHSLVAQREGIQVRAITLWLLGGVAELEREAETPGSEFRIAAAGPAVSVALALLFAGVSLGYEAVFGASLLATMLWWLAFVNGILAVFNLIPASPLDGGRILTAALWWRTGDPNRARARSAMAGQVFGSLMLGVGTLALFSGGGIWLLILGWFLLAGAATERRRAELFSAAAHTTVGQVMVPLAPATDGAVTVAGLAAMSGPTGTAAFPVRGPRGDVVGIVPPTTLGRLNPRRHAATQAIDLIVPWADFVSARAGDPLPDAIEQMRTTGSTHVLVYDAWGRQVGYLGLDQLARASKLTPA